MIILLCLATQQVTQSLPNLFQEMSNYLMVTLETLGTNFLK